MDTSLISCPKCGGTGFRLSVALDKQYRHQIPFAVLMTEAEACDCLAGPWFAGRQLEYMGMNPAHPVPQDESGWLRRMSGIGKLIPMRQIA